MIGLDANVLVRYFAQDDAAQSPLATQLIEGLTTEAPGFISTVTLVETVWVLSKAYRTPRARIGATIEGLLRAREMVVENAEAAYLALNLYQTTTIDFADGLIAQTARLAGCHETVTFDIAAADGAGMRLLHPTS